MVPPSFHNAPPLPLHGLLKHPLFEAFVMLIVESYHL